MEATHWGRWARQLPLPAEFGVLVAPPLVGGVVVGSLRALTQFDKAGVTASSSKPAASNPLKVRVRKLWLISPSLIFKRWWCCEQRLRLQGRACMHDVLSSAVLCSLPAKADLAICILTINILSTTEGLCAGRRQGWNSHSVDITDFCAAKLQRKRTAKCISRRRRKRRPCRGWPAGHPSRQAAAPRTAAALEVPVEQEAPGQTPFHILHAEAPYMRFEDPLAR